LFKIIVNQKSREEEKMLKKFLAVFLTPFIILVTCPVIPARASDASRPKSTTEIVHKAIESVEAGKRIPVLTEISDEKGVDVVRVYFKSKDAADYSFIPLRHAAGEDYSGTLPAPANGSQSFEYLILVKNKANIVVKSQTYLVMVEDGDEAVAAGQEPVQVYSELSQMPSEITGFSDNIVIDVVESGGKLGAVVGLYAGLSADGGGALSGGTVVASSGGVSTAAVVVGTTVVLAAAGGAVAIAASASDDDDGGEPLTAATIVGAWNYRGRNDTIGCTETGTANFAAGGSFTQSGTTVCQNSTPFSSTGVGRWSLVGQTFTLTYSTGVSASGTASGNSNSFTTNQTNGWVVTYTR
jgi:hypothetical protein